LNKEFGGRFFSSDGADPQRREIPSFGKRCLEEGPVEGGNPQKLEPAPGAVGSLVKLKIGDLFAFKEDGGLLRVQFAPPLHLPGNVHGFDHRRHTVFPHGPRALNLSLVFAV